MMSTPGSTFEGEEEGEVAVELGRVAGGRVAGGRVAGGLVVCHQAAVASLPQSGHLSSVLGPVDGRRNSSYKYQ